jgi:hypothetical protein
MEAYDPADFLRQLAPHILAELKPPADLKRFTTNSDVVGAYVEAGVRQLVRRYLAPIRVCTGAVIDQAQSPGSKRVPQLDTIAWVPGPVPAVFEVGEFALVPRSSSLGILEVKSSAYDVPKLERQTDPELIKSVTADPLPTERLEQVIFGMGVVSVLQQDQGSAKLKDLRAAGRIVVLFQEQGESYIPQTTDIYRLVNFLATLRWRAAAREGQVQINMDLLARRPT